MFCFDGEKWRSHLQTFSSKQEVKEIKTPSAERASRAADTCYLWHESYFEKTGPVSPGPVVPDITVLVRTGPHTSNQNKAIKSKNRQKLCHTVLLFTASRRPPSGLFSPSMPCSCMGLMLEENASQETWRWVKPLPQQRQRLVNGDHVNVPETSHFKIICFDLNGCKVDLPNPWLCVS